VAGAHGARAKIAPMDTEQINAVGSLLADLSDRTQQLRGYL
jgi:hypothetical protein